MNVRSLFLLLGFAGLLPGQVNAFEIFGYHSGMSKNQAATHAARLGLDTWPAPDSAFAVGNARARRMDFTLGFCENVLVSYRRLITSDSEYFGIIKQLGVRYGPPSKVKASGGGEWSAQGKTSFQSALLIVWYRGDDRITLTTYPEGRMEWREGMGNFRHARQPGLDFVTRNPCGD